MKKRFAMILAAVMLLSLCACSAQPQIETKYFMTETVYEFSEDMVQKTVYHFDEDWTATGYTSYMNDEVEQEVTYTYDENNNLTMTMVSGDQTSTVQHIFTRNENEKPLKLEMVQDGTLYSTTEYTYDSEGNCATQTQTNNLTGMVTKITFTPDGRILSQESTGHDGIQSGADYTYDENGNEIKMVNYYTANGQPATTEMVSEYNADGKVSKETTTDYDSEGNVTRTYYTEYTYDGNTQTSQTIQGGEMVSKNVTTYDDAGNILSSEMHNPYSDQVTRFSYTWVAAEVPVK